MNNLFKIILTSVIIFSLGKPLKAQTPPAPGAHYTNTTMTAFHGTWRWTSGTDTVKLYLTTANVYYNINGGFTSDDLVGWYYYKRGNNVIFSNYSSIPNTFANGRISGYNSDESPNRVDGFYKDPIKNKSIKLSLVLYSSQNLLEWRSYIIGLVYGNRPTPPPGMTLPADMTFTKL